MRRGSFWSNRLAVAGFSVVAVVLVASACAPFLARYSYAEQDLALGSKPPSADHWLGTDDLGRDILSRMLYGARISFFVALVGTLVSVVIGVSYGAVSGFLGGKADAFLMRVVDVLYGLPLIFYVVVLMAFFGRSIVNLFAAVGAVQWLTMSRIVRGKVLAVKERPFVEAARASGASGGRIVLRHILPNIAGTVIVCASLTVPGVMLLEAFLSFLGLGVQAPMPSWGTLILDGADSMGARWWLLLFPASGFTLTLLGLNFIGDGLRDALDPQLR